MKEGSGIHISQRHWSLKEKAQKLRAKGWSYKEILQEVPVSKSSISLWCRNIVLSENQKKRLGEKRDQSLKGIRAIQKMYWDKRCLAFEEGVAMTKKVKNPKFVAGLMLYWAEGNKTFHCGIANSDGRVIKFMVHWFQDFFGITPDSIKLHLHLHSGQNERNMKKYWSDLTGIPLQNFQKSFIKPEGSGYRKNILYQGTVRVRPMGGSTYLLFRVLGAIAGYLSQTINEKVSMEDWIPRLPYA